jgi:predicted dehydrogenase
MSEKQLRWGVLSTARIGKKEVNPAIQASANGELVAVASRDEERARAFAEEGGIPQVFGSYQALLEDPDIDAVYNPLPNSLHREWTIRAAEHGKHILCEKPMAVDAAECREMKDAAAANGVKLMEAFMYRFHPRTEQILEMVRNESMGEIKQIRSSFTFQLDRPDDVRWDPALGGGALMDLGCYCVNLSRTFVGMEPLEVRAMANFTDQGVDQQMAGSMRFENGVLAHFDCALNMEKTQVYHIFGSNGHVRVLEAFVPGTEATSVEMFDLEDNLTRVPTPGGDQYRLMVEHFADCVLNDRPVRWGPDDADLNMRVIQALAESARKEGETVAVEEGA